MCFKAILSACSPWFEEVLLENQQHPNPIIIIKDIRYEDLKNILRLAAINGIFNA